jgi:hypothetical protein
MPNIEVRALDLRHQLATPLPLGSDSISTSGLNYAWVHVEDAEGKVETHLRFKVTDRQLILRADKYPATVKEVEAEFRRHHPDYCGDITWQATMVHYPIPGVARIESGIITVGDELEVGVYGLGDDSHGSSSVSLGRVTKIIVGLS